MTAAEQAQIEGRPLLLYDGVCVLCNGVVRFILRHDKQAAFRFTPLEGPLGREILARFNLQETPPHEIPDGVVLITATLTPFERIYHRSDAVAEALQLLGRSWGPLGKALATIPRPLREAGYRLVARLRYRLFGRYATCPLPAPDQRSRILGVY
jgi:predicted DCC family thiol-disulfide oxidoreductase YuxK